MLIVSRKKNQVVIITMPDGTRCRVQVVEIRGEKARLGFDFPKHVSVNREEVQEVIDREHGPPLRAFMEPPARDERSRPDSPIVRR